MLLKRILPILVLFVFVNTTALIGLFQSLEIGINLYFLIVVNTMLLFMSLYSYYRIRSMDPSNANAMVRSVMLGTLLKMAVFAGAALIYAMQKKGPVGIPTLLVSMALYIVYTWFEIRWAIKKK